MRIAEGVEMLELAEEGAAEGHAFCAALIWDEKDAVLVDTGVPGMLPVLKKALEKAGVPFPMINRVFITHHDFDHLGGLPEILETAEKKVEVLAHEAEKPYIEGKKNLLVKLEKVTKMLPAAEREKEINTYLSRQTVTVDTVVADGQELPYCGGITAIHTPGHTPGHLCLYVKKAKTLIAGDSTVAQDGRLAGPIDLFTVDMQEAYKSLAKLAEYDIENVICYHGGLVRGNIKEQIMELVKRTK
jgi:glyoxylase-like metal-dependent hydrolase (beta-lactamase superfamily II)